MKRSDFINYLRVASFSLDSTTRLSGGDTCSVYSSDSIREYVWYVHKSYADLFRYGKLVTHYPFS